MQLVLSEARKQRSFREVWVGYLLAILLLSVFIYSDLGELRMNSSWFQIQQDIHRYVGVLTAFLLVIGLSRLMWLWRRNKKLRGLVGTRRARPVSDMAGKGWIVAPILYSCGICTWGRDPWYSWRFDRFPRRLYTCFRVCAF